ncbi:MAG TPA: hypothetical protein VK711_08015 [Puia sp.]|nr:hypothetical protein [Puia sp.]
MRSTNHPNKGIIICSIILIIFFPAFLKAEVKIWSGLGGDSNWSNPLNWTDRSLPLSTDDVLLDNRNVPLSFTILLPDVVVIVKTLIINPSPGRNIEVILPSSNINANAFTVTGPGYGIELHDGAIFRNISGISSGESLQIADSIIIYDGGRYIHQTRGSHANNILRFLSTASGTEQGIFDFDVPRASYTISVSNRIYGCLELHSTAFGNSVNYTCTGANPLLVRGNLRIGANVSMSMDLSGINGNIQVEGDFIQEGGRLNLASGNGDNSVLRIQGDLYQSPSAIITETSNGNPWLELNGVRMQEIDMSGLILNQVGFRINNSAGSELRQPLTLPWKLELNRGEIISTIDAMLTLDTVCSIIIDSSRLTESYIAGPLRKLGLNQLDHFLFPVGKDKNLRWLELKNPSGNYTVEYFHQDPASIGTVLENGLDHISKLEYWKVIADGELNDKAKIELSFSSVQSGGVTDPEHLNVAKFQSGKWEDAGHETSTGNFIQGSVISGDIDFAAIDYTLASTLNMENPLPMTMIKMDVKEISEKPVFNWTIESPVTPDHFDLYEETSGHPILIANIMAINQQKNYSWTYNNPLAIGDHYFRIRMVDIHRNEYEGNIVFFKMDGRNILFNWLGMNNSSGSSQLLIQSDQRDELKYEISSVQGKIVKRGAMKLAEGRNYLPLGEEIISRGVYIFYAINITGNHYSLLFRK